MVDEVDFVGVSQPHARKKYVDWAGGNHPENDILSQHSTCKPSNETGMELYCTASCLQSACGQGLNIWTLHVCCQSLQHRRPTRHSLQSPTAITGCTVATVAQHKRIHAYPACLYFRLALLHVPAPRAPWARSQPLPDHQKIRCAGSQHDSPQPLYAQQCHMQSNRCPTIRLPEHSQRDSPGTPQTWLRVIS